MGLPPTVPTISSATEGDAGTGTGFLPSTWKRLFASWIDSTPVMIALTVATLPSLPEAFHVSWPFLIAASSACLLYHACFLYYFGATPGKMFYGLKVVSDRDLGPLSLRQAIVRTLVSIVAPTVISAIPQSVALFRADRRQLADLAAGTRVVQGKPRNVPPHPRYVIGALLVLGALIASMNTLINYRKYHVSADGLQLDLIPQSDS